MKVQVKKRIHILNDALDVLQFGKYNGKTVQDVLDSDPQYILWVHDNKVAIVAEHLLDYAMEDERDWHDVLVHNLTHDQEEDLY